MVLHGFASRSPKNIVFPSNNLKVKPKTQNCNQKQCFKNAGFYFVRNSESKPTRKCGGSVEELLTRLFKLHMKDFPDFSGIFGSRSVFDINIKFCERATMFFGFLDAKPCRTIMKLPQKVSFRPEMCQIGPKL